MLDQNNSEILVSVIIPLYKGQQYIEKLRRMLQKNAEHLHESMKRSLEVIFVNDFPDEQITKVKIEGVHVSCLNCDENEGIHGARVKGLQAASGEYVLFLDQDDEIDEKYIVNQMHMIEDADAVLCNGVYRENRLIYSDLFKQRQTVKLENYIKSPTTIISPGQIIIKKDCIPQAWKQNIMKNNGLDDCFLWILLMKKDTKFSINQERLYKHNEGGRNASFNWRRMNLSRIEMLSILKRLRVLSDTEYDVLEKSMRKSIEKAESYALLDESWNELEKHNVSLGDFLQKRGYSKIAIYGMGVYGLKLYYTVQGEDVEVCYGIDQYADSIKGNLKIISREDDYPPVDIIINSATFANDEIKIFLQQKTDAEVVGLDEILQRALK